MKPISTHVMDYTMNNCGSKIYACRGIVSIYLICPWKYHHDSVPDIAWTTADLLQIEP